MADDFPQSGLLQALFARSSKGEGMHRAAVSFNTRALYVIMNAYENLAEVPEEQIIQQADASVNYGGTSEVQPEDETEELNDFSHGELKDILGFEPQTDQEEVADKVVIAEDERHEVNNIAFETEPEPVIQEETPVEPEPLIELEHKAAEVAPEILIQEIETPAEDDRAEIFTPIFEEEIIELPGEETAIAESFYTQEPVTEEPAEDHRAETGSRVYEEEIVELPAVGEGIIDEEPAATEDVRPQPAIGIDDEVYDEIVGIENISFAREKSPVEEVVQPEIAAASVDETEGPVYEEIADTSYFVFEKEERRAFVPEASTEVETGAEPIAAASDDFEADTQEVSKYHDDKMPYTFMWWLDKTRREHAGVYQPFKLDTTQAIKHNADETLQQQYYENIFHITTIEELDRAAEQQTIEFDMKNKEDRIIKKFITEEPHISPPSSDKLDNENKAKKSAEDQDELVTETLARIYVDQMLYHKAINTYKKLILKFPEKSRYFADQIEVLERKIN
jgi:hypothetical protein